ncbi:MULTISPECIES: BACON domain-containing protein [Dethiosulfovibrio]|uniref:BACON domain-containing protein n=2 Tax=Dethiosulfovibrio TaxID=47054 RepID=A0ABS9ES13_9BACT|nr:MULTISPECIES: BACON domain-containing carbohydrate-binding protein [Dethiosulfovibrio]MCF4115074.1 hypothetical protein [Dethiosulfovibrio russensis]MCF4143484.1 hypothetical protein [Dethiosulfovibrio marinus]MCF4145701.1 hypothetical protein [Dethiosulfovibrio acidaminovorans]
MRGSARTFGLWLLLSVSALFLGGCGSGGGSGGVSDGVYVIGQLHGDMAEELASVCETIPYVGGPVNGAIIVSDPEGLHSWYDEDSISAMREALSNGRVVAIEHGTQDEVDFFIDRLLSPEDGEDARLELGYEMPVGMTYVEFYGLKILSDDVFAYVVLNDDEMAPTVSNDLSAEFMVSSGDSYLFMSQDVTLNDGDRSFAVVRGDVTFSVRFDFDEKAYYLVSVDGLSKASEDELDLPVLMGTEFSFTGTTEETEREMELAAAKRVRDWIEGSSEQAREAERSRGELQSSLDRSGSGTDLTKVSQVYSVQNDLTTWGFSYRIIHDIYACHSYNAADGEDSDWFFIKQSAKLNPSKEYHNESGKGNDFSSCYFYITKYGFTNWPVKENGSEDVRPVVEGKSSPESTIGSKTVESSVSRSFSGNVGFDGAGPSGSIGFGVSYSSSESFSISECQIKNDSEAVEAKQRTSWTYTFSRPTSKAASFSIWDFPDLNDAPLSSRSNFQPVNQWIWKIPKEARDEVKGFKCRFDWQSGSSSGAAYAWGIRIYDVSHYDHLGGSPEITVTFPSYPPLIAANDVKLGREAQFTPVDMGTCRDWGAYSDSGWCRLNMVSGTKDDVKDLIVTVEENDTGSDRTATVYLFTKDGKGYDSFRVFQSHVTKAI